MQLPPGDLSSHEAPSVSFFGRYLAAVNWAGCENVNGLIREYVPKGDPLDDITQATLNRIAYLLNTRPRRTLRRR